MKRLVIFVLALTLIGCAGGLLNPPLHQIGCALAHQLVESQCSEKVATAAPLEAACGLLQAPDRDGEMRTIPIEHILHVIPLKHGTKIKVEGGGFETPLSYPVVYDKLVRAKCSG